MFQYPFQLTFISPLLILDVRYNEIQLYTWYEGLALPQHSQGSGLKVCVCVCEREIEKQGSSCAKPSTLYAVHSTQYNGSPHI